MLERKSQLSEGKLAALTENSSANSLRVVKAAYFKVRQKVVKFKANRFVCCVFAKN
jgi:hypothetical protein